MISFDSILLIEQTEMREAAKSLTGEDIAQLIEWLSLKDDKIRYQAFQLLQKRSEFFEDVSPYWDVLKEKLKSDNSYQRSIGLMLLAENARWAAKERLNEIMPDYLKLLHDEKPITIRQCIQFLSKIIPFAAELNGNITTSLLSLDLMEIKETMRKSILTDILNVLIEIKKENPRDDVDHYIINALGGGILDKKTKRQFEELL